MTTPDPRLGERLHRAADPLPLDVEARLEGSRRRAHVRHVRRRVSAGAVGLAIAVIGAVVVWDLRDVGEPVPVAPPELPGTIVYTTSEEHWGESHELRVSAPGAAVAPPSLSVVGSPVSFSPDGTRVASFVPTGKSLKDNYELEDLVVQRLPDGAPEVLVHSVAPAGQPVWGPGGRLAFWTYTEAFGDSYELQIAEPDGTIGDPLLHATGAPLAFAWSPDGNTIAVGMDDTSAVKEFGAVPRSLILMDPEGREVQQVYWPGGDIEWMRWSPDGSELAFGAFTRGGGTSNGVISVMNADGSDLRPVTPEDESSSHPVWSPDGEWIAFTSDRDMTDAQRRANHRRAFGNDRTPFEGVELYVMRPDGSEVTPLDTDGAGIPYLLAWLPPTSVGTPGPDDADIRGWPDTTRNQPGTYSLDGSRCGLPSGPDSCNVGFMHNGYASGDGGVAIYIEVVPDGGVTDGATAVSIAGHDGTYRRIGPRMEWWIVEIEGSTILISLEAQPGTSQAALAEAHAIIRSIRVDPQDDALRPNNHLGFRLLFTLTTDDWDSG
jgi:Tol biopolymer transport system component